MKWISVKNKSPEHDSMVLVINAKYGMETFQAFYHKDYNVFILSNPNIRETTLLDITHWIEIPDPPRFEEATKKQKATK